MNLQNSTLIWPPSHGGTMLCCTDLFDHIVSRKWISLAWYLHDPVKKCKTTSVEWFTDNVGGNIPSKEDKSVKADCKKSDESTKKVESSGHEKKDPKEEKDSGNIKVSRGAVYCDCDTIEVTDDDNSEEM